jgi:hypothetical protein
VLDELIISSERGCQCSSWELIRFYDLALRTAEDTGRSYLLPLQLWAVACTSPYSCVV